jgi:hypothetical protein
LNGDLTCASALRFLRLSCVRREVLPSMAISSYEPAAFRLDSAQGLCYMPGLTREPRPRDFDGRIAQLVEQLTLNQRVVGSSPTAPTIEINEINGLQER